MGGTQIQQLRKALGESVEEFGKRFFVSGRTVQNWEVERNSPHPAIQAQIEEMVRKQSKKSA